MVSTGRRGKLLYAAGLALLGTVTGTLAASRPAAAQAIPEPAPIPAHLSLDDSLKILRERGLDVLLAEAQVKSAEGDVGVASAVPNPSMSLSYGRLFNYSPPGCSGSPACDNNQYSAGLSDQAAIEDSIAGKRDLRLKVANAALAATKLSRDDAVRTLEFQVKSAYLQVAQARRALELAKQVQSTSVRTFELFQARLKSGAINEGEMARVETQKLESDQVVDEATVAVDQARLALAFLLGARGPVPPFEVDDHVLDYSVPAPIAAASVDKLLRSAFEHRPDLLALGYQRRSAEAALDLARRQRFPDVTLGLGYTQTGGQGAPLAVQPPVVSVSLSAPLPLFYQMQGEIRKAQATYDAQGLTQAKAVAQVVSDVSAAAAQVSASRDLVERMEKGGLLKSAKTARDITRTQYERGAGTLMDLLDAQRTYIATNVEYIGDLTGYWTAVSQLEEAVGMELRQ
ncbi:MAG: TolC family protein [Polyangiaceae bacterium]